MSLDITNIKDQKLFLTDFKQQLDELSQKLVTQAANINEQLINNNIGSKCLESAKNDKFQKLDKNAALGPLRDKEAKELNIINSLKKINYKLPTFYTGDWLNENNEIPQPFSDYCSSQDTIPVTKLNNKI